MRKQIHFRWAQALGALECVVKSKSRNFSSEMKILLTLRLDMCPSASPSAKRRALRRSLHAVALSGHVRSRHDVASMILRRRRTESISISLRLLGGVETVTVSL